LLKKRDGGSFLVCHAKLVELRHSLGVFILRDGLMAIKVCM